MAEERRGSLVAVRDTRERVIARLSDAFAHDELELEEFERRLGVAHRSESLVQLEELTADLQATDASALAAPGTALAPVSPVPGDRQAPARSLTAVLGGVARKGAWTPPRSWTARAAPCAPASSVSWT